MSVSHSEGGVLYTRLLHVEIMKEKIHTTSICHTSTIIQFEKKKVPANDTLHSLGYYEIKL